ncbi:uncharacterized protein A1O9_01427 [Exophiala aquamarina CBS 119918]|uniref:Uncharacterized protein n=1 Tax=Exophiala aquamarina CBS 119918 TaxID=1182545 RepID=A0A072PTL9_9EURO|nr:uncharacterized protein A1O9_01427 [Exophiala aquamarina CBS 119918]KEF63449.1 hypothetical protein A1O9_01427 [Exophiala aquamarina CBS 119918]
MSQHADKREQSFLTKGQDALTRHGSRDCAKEACKGLFGMPPVCVIDSTFKRTPTRLRLQSVTNELRQLREALNAQATEAASKTASTPSASDSTSSVALRDKSRVGQQRALPSSDPFGLNQDESCLLRLKEAQLEGCSFDQNDIRNLFLL